MNLTHEQLIDILKTKIEVDEYGTKWWYLNGQRHRVDGPAIEYSNGIKWWYLNGKIHRTDGPAVEYKDGSQWWYLNDELHRTDGPAIVESTGSKFWFLNGKQITEDEFNKRTTD